MDTLINAVLTNYVPTIIAISIIVGIFVLAIAGIIRNSGKHDDIARSNLIIQTVIIGFSMLFLSGAFVFAFHQTYVSKFYSGVQEAITNKLPSDSDIQDTNLLSSEVKETGVTVEEAKCILVVVDTVDCVKKTINDVIGVIIEKSVRGIGVVVQKAVQKFNFNFLFHLPAEVFDIGEGGNEDALARVINFNNLIRVSEIIGLAWVYILIVTHYFKSILFSLEKDYSSDFGGDAAKMFLGFSGVFLARYLAEALIKTVQAFADFLYSTPLANGLVAALKALITDGLWRSFDSFGISLVVLAVFVIIYIILFGFIIFRNAKRYFILLLMVLMAPIFTPMLFFDMTRVMGTIFWQKFIVTSFSLIFDLLILLIIFVFLSSGGLTLGNLLLMLVGMAIVAESNNLLQQIGNASEVAGFRSVISRTVKSGTGIYYKLRSMKS